MRFFVFRLLPWRQLDGSRWKNLRRWVLFVSPAVVASA